MFRSFINLNINRMRYILSLFFCTYYNCWTTIKCRGEIAGWSPTCGILLPIKIEVDSTLNEYLSRGQYKSQYDVKKKISYGNKKYIYQKKYQKG